MESVIDTGKGNETMRNLFGFALLLVGASGLAIAGLIPTTPEIDPSSAGAAVAMLAGGLLVIRYRRKK